MKKFYIGIKSEVSTNTLELYFTDYLYDGWDWSTYEPTNMVQETIDKVKAANPTTIKIIINSLGGDVMIGLALYNFLKSYKATKKVEILAFAGSIAATLAMCGDEISMPKNSFYIIHAAWSGIAGNATEMRKVADDLDKVTKELADIFAQRASKVDSKYNADYFISLWANGDYWMPASEAKALGLCDVVANVDVQMAASIDLKSYGFKNIPQSLIQSAATDPQQNFFSSIKDEFMKLFDSLKAAVSGAKADKKFDNVPNKDEILNLVESTLKPFAEAVDKKLAEVAGEEKPKEETTTTTTTTTTETTEKKEGTETTTEKKEGEEATTTPAATVTKPANEIEELRAQIKKQDDEMKKLRNQIASKEMTPKNEGKDAKDIMSKIKVEYEN